MTAERRLIYKNLIGFATTRPPCVVFAVFLTVFAVGFFAVGYYVQHSNIIDTTTSKEWNNLYSKLSSLTFCLNSSEIQNQTRISNPHSAVYDDFINISLPFQITVKPVPGDKAMNISQLSGTIPFYLLKSEDYFVNDYPLWIGLEPDSLLGPCVIMANDLHARCQEITYTACVTITVPSFILPTMKPKTCNGTSSSKLISTPVTVLGPEVRNGKMSRSACDNQLEMFLARGSQYDTRVLLSITERTQLNLRLQLAGYFVFVILLSFLLFAAIKGRHLKPLV